MSKAETRLPTLGREKIAYWADQGLAGCIVARFSHSERSAGTCNINPKVHHLQRRGPVYTLTFPPKCRVTGFPSDIDGRTRVAAQKTTIATIGALFAKFLPFETGPL